MQRPVTDQTPACGPDTEEFTITCPACVYAAAKVEGIGEMTGECAMGCVYDDDLCREMRTNRCSMRKRPVR